MSHVYQHLGVYSDWVAAAQAQQPLFPIAPPGLATQQRIRDVLGFCNRPEHAQEVQIHGCWERDGLVGESLSWSVGYGPRTEAWLLKPANARGPLPGIVALHDHGGFKFFGKEKIADGPADLPSFVHDWRAISYGGRAFANALANEGFVVLVHDTFLWGSRKFPLEAMPQELYERAATVKQVWWTNATVPPEVSVYEAAAGDHEHVIAKYANILGTSLAGMVSHEDRIAVNYLCSRPDVQPSSVGCIGLSGGGNRAALLQATHNHIGATAIVGLMSSYAELLDQNMSHTWMLFPFGWARYGDWPDIAACRAPSPLLVQYDLDDMLFTEKGMRQADARITKHYNSVGAPEAYTGVFYPGPHKFDLEMQVAAFAWLKQQFAKAVA